jgi:hypothetical protein
MHVILFRILCILLRNIVVGLGLEVHERVETNEVEVLTKGNALEY